MNTPDNDPIKRAKRLGPSPVKLSDDKIYKLALNGRQVLTIIHALRTMDHATREAMKGVVIAPPVRMARQAESERYNAALNTIEFQTDQQP
jgi:hypothetical protein